jgi:HAD superfamily hydrolase (TIGR01509 family)
VTRELGERRAPLKAGAIALLDRIAALGLPTAVCTSSGSMWAHRHLEGHGIAPRFRAVVTRDDVARGKPDPEPYFTVAAAIGVAPPDILVVEDSPTGLAAAHAAGTMPVLVPDLVPPTELCLTRAVYVARSLAEVQERFFSPA